MKKKITLYIASALLLLTGGACSDWLDVDPIDKVLEDKQYSTEDNINSALNGLYRQMTAKDLYGGKLSQTTIETMGHYYFYPDKLETSGTGNEIVYQLGNFSYETTKAISVFNSLWTTAYKTLLNINNFIKGVNESDAVMSADHKNIVLGEAYALRAYLHFDLYRLFVSRTAKGTDQVLPYSNQPDITLNQVGYDEKVYVTADKYIELLKADIEEALALLQKDPVLDPAQASTCITKTLEEGFYNNRNRRLNYYGVVGLKARLLQYIGETAEAARTAKVVTDRMEKDDLFHWTGSASEVVNNRDYVFFSEVVFGINSLDFISNGKSYYDGININAEVYVVDTRNLYSNIFADYPSSSLDVMPDSRSRQWTASYITNGSQSSYTSLKYKIDNAEAADRIPAVVGLQVLIRVPEMYYIQSESALAGGDKAAAIGFLKKVLEHRGYTQTLLDALDNMSDAEVRAFITREYYREFFGEGQCFFYHKRLQSTEMFYGGKDGSGKVEAGNYDIPIPQAEKDADF